MGGESRRQRLRRDEAQRRLQTPTGFVDAKRDYDVAVAVMIAAANRIHQGAAAADFVYGTLVRLLASFKAAGQADKVAAAMGAELAARVRSLRASRAAGRPEPEPEGEA